MNNNQEIDDLLTENELNKMAQKMQEIGYEKFYNKQSKPQKPMSNLEWKIRCFIHKVKRKIGNLLSYFSNYNEE